MKNNLKFVLRFILYVIICTITSMILDKIVHQIPFTSYNVVENLHIIVLISLAISTGQLTKKIGIK